MKLPSPPKALYIGMAIFAGLLVILSALPCETIVSFHNKRRAQKKPEAYDKCPICLFWFKHDDMAHTPEHGWVCDICRAKYELYLNNAEGNALYEKIGRKWRLK